LDWFWLELRPLLERFGFDCLKLSGPVVRLRSK
jgi:hypothetical protein